MKTFYRHIILASLLMILHFNVSQAQTTLAANDVVVLWCLGETTNTPSGSTANNDRVGLLLLKEITAGTEINIADSGSNNCTSLETDEGEVTYTATMTLPAFTVLDIYVHQSSTSTGLGPDDNYAVPAGTMSYVGGMALATSGDQVFVYQGDRTSPTFIYSAFFDGTSWDSPGSCSGACSGSQSEEPCSGGTFAFGASASSEFDNAWYNGPLGFTDAADALAKINNPANWTGENNNTGIGETAADNMAANLGLLPIEISSITARNNDKTNVISWQTITEINNDVMVIERSIDSRNFTEIGRVEGAGTTYDVQNYEFIDEVPVRGMNYYRLRQVDFDGTTAYSDIVSVKFGEANDVSVFPNPTTADITLTFAQETARETEVQILSQNGSVVKTEVLAANTLQQNLNVNNLSTGIYFVRIITGNTVETLRFVKK